MLKRIFDLVLSILLIFLTAPLMALIAFLIYFKMGSPVLFKQQRPGFKCRPFILYKFRSMADTAYKNGFLLRDEDRLTRLGLFLRRFSLDELPQLFNVLKGELSFIGPRPLLAQYLERYTPEQARRHDVKPGITGWAQVNGRNAICWEEKFEYDVWYVDNSSFWLDMKILWLTVIKVLRAEGISGEGSATMSEFMGSDQGRD